MRFPPSRRPMNKLILTGYFFLLLALGLNYLVSHQIVPGTDLIDALNGLLFGICFASILLGVRRSSSCRSGASPTD